MRFEAPLIVMAGLALGVGSATAQPVPVCGLVLDQSLKPVAGATVLVVARQPESTVPPQRAETATDGRFRFALRPEDVVELHRNVGFSVWAWKSGYAPIEHHITCYYPPEGRDVRLVLEEVTPSRVAVRDPHGAPVVGARVSVTGFTQMSSKVPEQLGPVLSRDSDTGGVVSFDDIPWSEAHTIEVDHPNFGKQSFIRQWDGRGGATLDLLAAGRVEGVLRDEGGDPLAGVDLWLRTDGADAGRWQRRSSRARVTTAEDGRFTVPHIGPGRLLLDLVRPRGARRQLNLRYRPQDVVAGETLALEIGTVAVPERNDRSPEAAKGIVCGVVQDGHGEPVAGAWVRSSASKTREGGFTTSEHRNAITAEDGSFELCELAVDAAVRVRATLGPRRSALVTTTPAAAPESVILTMSARALVAFRGRVVDAEGRPVAGARVRAWWRGGTDTNPEQRSEQERSFTGQQWMLTDAQGWYRTPHPVPHEHDYRVAVLRDGTALAASEWWTPPETGDGVLPDVIVGASVSLTVRVCDITGQPQSGVRVRHPLAAGREVVAVTDPDGRAVLEPFERSWPLLHLAVPGAPLQWRWAGNEQPTYVVRLGENPPPDPQAAPPFDRDARRKIALPILEPLLELARAEGGTEVARLLRVLAPWDPRRVNGLINAETIPKTWYRDYARRALAEALAANDPDAARAVWESMESASSRTSGLLAMEERCSGTDAVARRDLLARALLQVRAIDDASHRILYAGKVAGRLVMAGQDAAAAGVFREFRDQAEALPASEWAGYARSTFAENLALIDLEAAMTLIDAATDPFERDRHRGNAAHYLAARDPAAAQRVHRGMTAGSRDRWASRICHDMAPVDLERAHSIAQSIGDAHQRAHAHHVMALALTETDRDAARTLLEEAFAVLEGDPDSRPWIGSHAAVAAAFLPAVERVAPKSLRAYIGRCLALRTVPGADLGPRLTRRIARDALVATLVARYDPGLARRLVPDLILELRETEGWDHDEREVVTIALAVLDPAGAAALFAGPPPQGNDGSWERRRRQIFTRALAADAAGIWNLLADRRLTLWVPGTDDI